MNIVQLCLRFHPAPGGVETHVLHLSRQLIGRGNDVTVLTSDLYTETPHERLDDDHLKETVEGITVERFRSRTLPGAVHYTLFPSIKDRLMEIETEVFHAHSYGYYHVNVASSMKKKRDIPFVITTHFHPEWSISEGTARRMLRKAYDRLVGKGTLDAADAVICVSNAERDLLREMKVDEDKLHVIPNGVDLDSYSDLPSPDIFRKATGIDAPFVLYAGRLAENKRPDVLVDAFAVLAKKDTEHHLVIIGGDGGSMERTRELVEGHGLGTRVHILGHIEDEQVFRSAYSACELFALTSDFEAFGIVLAEAMAAGKACVATKVGGTADVVDEGRTGLLVGPGDPKGFAKAMGGLLADPARRKAMGRAGRERVEENFTWKKIAESVEAVYKSVK